MKIRKATKKDLTRIAELSYELHRDQMERCSVHFNLDKNFRALKKKAYQKTLDKREGVFFVAEEKGKIVGVIAGKVEKNSPGFVEKKKGHVGAFYIIPEFRNKGIGTKLFSKLKEWFKRRKLKRITITIARRNKKAKQLYKEFGFDSEFETWKMRL